MSKRISKILSILLSASLAAASVPVIPLAAYADDGTTSSTSETQNPGDKKDDAGLTLNPVVVNYSILDSKGKEQKTIYKNTSFVMKMTIKDIKVKTSQVTGGGAGIDFLKSVDSFKGTLESLTVVSQGDELLRYDIVLKDCKWVGDDKNFGFKVGYIGGSDYVDGSVNVLECTTSDSTPTPDESNPEPIIKITAVEPDSPIKAGEEGEFKIRLKTSEQPPRTIYLQRSLPLRRYSLRKAPAHRISRASASRTRRYSQ